MKSQDAISLAKSAIDEKTSFTKFMQAIETSYLAEALERYPTKKKVSEILKIPLSTLLHKRKLYGIDALLTNTP